jgi:hypothetical protein
MAGWMMDGPKNSIMLAGRPLRAADYEIDHSFML